MTVKKTFKWSIPLLIGLSSCFLWLSNAYAGGPLSAGINHVCGIKDDSTLFCWGSNADDKATWPEGTFTQVSAGFNFNCALRTNGAITCWGQDTEGSTSPPPGHYIQIEAGGNHACALADNGAPICWGANSSSQSSYPSGPFQQLALGNAHSCGLKMDGTVECWGDNSNGQKDPPENTTFSSIAAGFQTTCGVKTDGVAICWGRFENSYGYLTRIALSINGPSDRGSPKFCGLKTTEYILSCPSMNDTPSGVFSYVTTGGHNQYYCDDRPVSTCWKSHYEFSGFACGIRENGMVACWGKNNEGRATPPIDVTFKGPTPPERPVILTLAHLDAAYEKGRQAGIANPASSSTLSDGDISAILGTDFSSYNPPIDLCLDGNTCGQFWYPPLKPNDFQGEIPIDRFRRDDGNLWYNPVRFQSLDTADISDAIDATHYRTAAYQNAIEGFFQIRYACEASWNSGAKDLPWIPANVVGAIEYCVYPDNIPEVVNYLRATADKLACENGMEVCE